jgi:acylphosphatase
MATVHLRISGGVQGVNYREAMRREGERLGVTGWVRNRTDGSVEAVVQGPPASVDEMVAWARRGPPAARVDSVQVRPADGELARAYTDFRRLPSA